LDIELRAYDISQGERGNGGTKEFHKGERVISSSKKI
jgi:hypothetical protein